MQIGTYEKPYRDTIINDLRNQSDYTEKVLGLLPMSHIYGLVVICHANVYRGDGVIVLPKFEFASTLQAIQDYKISTLFLVGFLVLLYNIEKLTCQGATDHHLDDEEREVVGQVRPQLCMVDIHRRGTAGARDCRGPAEDLP